jgi:amidase
MNPSNNLRDSDCAGFYIKLEELTIADIHKAYVEGAYNSHDLVTAYISAIEKIDEEINAVTIINPDALNIALFLDEEYQKGRDIGDGY